MLDIKTTKSVQGDRISLVTSKIGGLAETIDLDVQPLERKVHALSRLDPVTRDYLVSVGWKPNITL